MRLFHLSDDPDIAVFHPRPSAYTSDPVVWAIAENRMANYLLPRDCPRVCLRANPNARRDDIERFLGEEAAIVAIEAAWADRLAAECLHRYEMPPATFTLVDEPAGYWTSQASIVPSCVTTLDDLPAAIAGQGARLVILDTLWPLHDAVAASTLTFSMIRMRNAAPRPA